MTSYQGRHFRQLAVSCASCIGKQTGVKQNIRVLAPTMMYSNLSRDTLHLTMKQYCTIEWRSHHWKALETTPCLLWETVTYIVIPNISHLPTLLLEQCSSGYYSSVQKGANTLWLTDRSAHLYCVSHAIRKGRCNFLLVYIGILYIIWATLSSKHIYICEVQSKL